MVVLFPYLDEPRISLPETFGACARTPLKMSVTLLDEKHQYSSSWSVNWYYITLWKGKTRLRKLKAKNSVTLTVPNPLPEHTGQEYEVEVRNPFGIARGVTRIVVTEGKVFNNFGLIYQLLFPAKTNSGLHQQ